MCRFYANAMSFYRASEDFGIGKILGQIPCGYQETTVCVMSFHSYDTLEQAKLFSGDRKQWLTGAGNGWWGWAWLGHGGGVIKLASPGSSLTHCEPLCPTLLSETSP